MSTDPAEYSKSNLIPHPPPIQGYHLLELIGSGGYGNVYRAYQKSTSQTVALKLLQMDQTLSDVQRSRNIERFKREAQLCAQLKHPHIVKLLDQGQTEDHQIFVVFEYVTGKTLKDVLIQQGALSPQDTSDLMGQILDALASAHARGIVHRDLKPQNIMINMEGLHRHALADLLRRALRKNPRDRTAHTERLYKDLKSTNVSNLVGVMQTNQPMLGNEELLL